MPSDPSDPSDVPEIWRASARKKHIRNIFIYTIDPSDDDLADLVNTSLNTSGESAHQPISFTHLYNIVEGLRNI